MQAHLCHPLLRSPAMDVVKVTYYFITTGIPINTSERHSSNSKLTVVWPMKSTTYLCCAAMAEKLSEKLHLHCTGCNIFVDWYGMPSSLCSLATNGIIFQALFSRFSITHPSSSTTTFSLLLELYLLKQLSSGCAYCRTQAHRLYIFL